VDSLEGQGHVAMLTAPELFTAEVLDFVRASPREAVGSERAGEPCGNGRFEIGTLMDLCEEGRPGTFRVVATG
jgi:hypothetical protein